MTREDKKKIERRAYWHDLLRQLRGTPDFPVKLFFHALFLVGAVYVATKQAILREQVKHIELISPILKAAMYRPHKPRGDAARFAPQAPRQG